MCGHERRALRLDRFDDRKVLQQQKFPAFVYTAGGLLRKPIFFANHSKAILFVVPTRVVCAMREVPLSISHEQYARTLSLHSLVPGIPDKIAYEFGGGAPLTELSPDRFVVWRAILDPLAGETQTWLEITELSTSCTLERNTTRIGLPCALVPQSVYAFADASQGYGALHVTFATRAKTLHRLTFFYPGPQLSASAFSGSYVHRFCGNVWRFSTANTARWIDPVTIALGCASGAVVVVRMRDPANLPPPSQSGAALNVAHEEMELKDGSRLQKLWTGFLPLTGLAKYVAHFLLRLFGFCNTGMLARIQHICRQLSNIPVLPNDTRGSAANEVEDLDCLHVSTIGDVFTFAVGRDGKIRCWSIHRKTLVATVDIPSYSTDYGDTADTAPALPMRIRLAPFGLHGNATLVVFSGKCFHVYSVHVRSAGDTLKAKFVLERTLLPPLPPATAAGRRDEWLLVDFHIARAAEAAVIFALWFHPAEMRPAVYYGHVDVDDGADECGEGWWHAAVLDDAATAADVDPRGVTGRELSADEWRDYYVDTLFHSGRFSLRHIAAAHEAAVPAVAGGGPSLATGDISRLQSLVTTDLAVAVADAREANQNAADGDIAAYRAWRGLAAAAFRKWQDDRVPLGMFVAAAPVVVMRRTAAVLREFEGALERLAVDTQRHVHVDTGEADVAALFDCLFQIRKALGVPALAQFEIMLTAEGMRPVDAAVTLVSTLATATDGAVSALCRQLKRLQRPLETITGVLADLETGLAVADTAAAAPPSENGRAAGLQGRTAEALVAMATLQCVGWRYEVVRDLTLLLLAVQRMRGTTGLSVSTLQTLQRDALPKAVAALSRLVAARWALRQHAVSTMSTSSALHDRMAALDLAGSGRPANEYAAHVYFRELAGVLSTMSTPTGPLASSHGPLLAVTRRVVAGTYATPAEFEGALLRHSLLHALRGFAVLLGNDAAVVPPDTLYMLAKCHLAGGTVDAAEAAFSRLANQLRGLRGASAAEAAPLLFSEIGRERGGAVPPGLPWQPEWQPLLAYYVHVCGLFEAAGQWEAGVRVAMEALAELDARRAAIGSAEEWQAFVDMSTALWTYVFRHGIEHGRFSSAYVAMTSLPNREKRIELLRRFVVDVCTAAGVPSDPNVRPQDLPNKDTAPAELLCRLPFEVPHGVVQLERGIVARDGEGVDIAMAAAELSAAAEPDISVAMVEDILLEKARAGDMQQAVDSGDTWRPGYYDICYAFTVYRGNYRHAAHIMYEYARRLSTELHIVPTPQVPPAVLLNALQKKVNCYAAALQALRAVEPQYRWLVLCPLLGNRNKRKFDAYAEAMEAQAEVEEDSGRQTVDMADIVREHMMASAQLELARKGVDAASAMAALDPQDLVVLLVRHELFDRAEAIAAECTPSNYGNTGYDLLRLVVEGLAQSCATSMLRYVHTSDAARTAARAERWRELERLLERRDGHDRNYELHVAAVAACLSVDSRIRPSLKITSKLQNENPEALTRVYLQFGLVDEAARVIVETLKERSAKLKNGDTRRTFVPYNLIDAVMAALTALPEHPRLKELTHELKKHLDVATRCSHELRRAAEQEVDDMEE